jgi:hypothetical protein
MAWRKNWRGIRFWEDARERLFKFDPCRNAYTRLARPLQEGECEVFRQNTGESPLRLFTERSFFLNKALK